MAPTQAPTVAPPAPTCYWNSPLASTFLGVTNTISVSTSAQLTAALGSLTQPTIIMLNTSGTYVLDKAYNVQKNLCIQVGWKWYS